MRTRTPRVPPRLWPALLLAALWTAAQVLVASGGVADDVREQLAVWKNALGIAFFLAGGLAFPSGLRPTRLALLAAPFPLYATFRLGSGGDLTLIGLYVAWWWGFFIVVPAAFRDRLWYRRLIGWIVGAALVATALGIAFGLAEGQVYWWDNERLVFSFTNPIYFAYGGLALAVGGFFLLPRSGRHMRLLCTLLLAFGAAVVVGARARNAILFAVAFAVVYLTSGRRERLVSTALLAIGALAVAVALYAQLADRLDQISSGRLSLWEAVIERNMGDMTPGEALFGVGELEQTLLVSHDSVVAEARFARAHADNAYLDLFVSLGLVGVVLFVSPLVLVARDLLRAIARYHEYEALARDLRAAVATLAGLLVQGLVVSNLPSLGNLMNLLCMTLVMAVWGYCRRVDASMVRARVAAARGRA
jgi:hypothetical protein